MLDGTPTLLIDGEPHALTPGTFARLDPEPVRIVSNEGSEPASLLIISAPALERLRKDGLVLSPTRT